MKELFDDKIRVLISVFLILFALPGCSDRSAAKSLIGLPVVEFRVESGFRFRREYLVYSRKSEGEVKIFNRICSKFETKFNDPEIFNPPAMEYEVGKVGFKPDISKWFDEIYTNALSRHYSISSKNLLSTVNVYESENYVCVILADGS